LKPWRFLTKPRGDRRWDLFLRATGLAAAVLIPIPILFPGLVPLVWLAIVGIPANGPLSPILPTAFDPLLMEVGKYAAPLSVTVVATGVYMYTEFLNWHIYAWVLNWDRMDRFRENRWVRWGVDRFSVAPITTIIFFAVTPLPFWVVRGLAILHQYSLTRFMVATAVGRFPRFLAYAWLGSALSIPTYVIVAVIVLGGVVAIGARIVKGEAILGDVVIDGGPDALTAKTIPLPEDSAV
jgi:membrane protein YqaA with SNARE-associated domain